MAGVSHKIFPSSDDDLERFLLFWLDAEVHTADHNQETQKILRCIVNHLRTFDNISQCQQVIESLSQQDRLILIVSGRLGREILPQIHHLRQLSSVYVYCMNKQLNEQWAQQFAKV
jgi:hypothetical protein